MMFGWEALLPLDLVFGQAEPTQGTNQTVYAANLYVSEWNRYTSLPANILRLQETTRTRIMATVLWINRDVTKGGRERWRRHCSVENPH